MQGRPRRVLYVEFNEDHTVGGSHRAVFDLVRHLPRNRYEPVVLYYQDNPYANRLRALGVQVIIVAEARARERDANANGTYLRRRMQQLRGIWWRRALLRREHIDIVHLNGTPFLGADDWLPAARLARVPCVVTALSIIMSTHTPVHRMLARRFDRVIAISESVETGLRASGIPPERMRRVYLGVDIDELRARVVTPRDVVRQTLGVADDTVLVTMVGNVRRWKGQHVVVAALTTLPDAVRRRMRVLFVGATSPESESYAATLAATVETERLGEIVTFLGPRTDVPDLLAATDVAIHASVEPEPFGLVVPEAMALGAAVIAAGAGGPLEIVTPTTGMLFDPASPAELAAHLTTLVTDADRRRALALAGPDRAQHFSIGRHVAGNVAVYDAL
jgi:glycosyltransferase involved in cell wall biosynthesis